MILRNAPFTIAFLPTEFSQYNYETSPINLLYSHTTDPNETIFLKEMDMFRVLTVAFSEFVFFRLGSTSNINLLYGIAFHKL